MENTHKHIQIYNAYKIYSTHAHTYACTQTAESTVGKRQEPSCSTKWKTRSSYLSNFLQGSSVEGHMCLRERQRDREREREQQIEMGWGFYLLVFLWTIWYYALSSIVILKTRFVC